MDPYLLVAILPLLGYLLGRESIRRASPPAAPPTPPMALPSPDRDLEVRILAALEALRAEVAELAERQDFMERLLGEHRNRPALRGPAETTPH